MKEPLRAFLRGHFGAVNEHAPYADELLREFLGLGPLHAFIPTALGGQYQGAASCLEVVEETSYWSVPLGLTLGIAGSLFLRPLVRFAAPAVRDAVVGDFLSGPALGGIMVTEPTGGTDIFSLHTAYTDDGARLRLRGTKCWAGLTGRAEHWLVAARLARGDQLTKRLNLIYVPLAATGVRVETVFDALGLRPIPYGQTRYQDVEVPRSHLVAVPGQTGLRVIYETLFRTRLGMPAIAAGLCRRLVDEATQRVGNRSSFGTLLADYDQVRCRLEELRAKAEINRRLWRFACLWMDRHEDVATDYALVNAAKVVSSETMQTAADAALQLFASAGYRASHLVGRAYVDARPFLIFEGSNDVLDENTFQAVLGGQGRFDRAAVTAQLARYGLAFPDQVPAAAMAALDGPEAGRQRQQAQLGRLVSWLLVLALLQHDEVADPDPADPSATDLGVRLACRRLAELAAALPYLS